MIKDVLSVVDTLLGLIRRSEEKEKELFEIHVEQIFNEMVLIHKDYRARLQEVFLWVYGEEIDRDNINRLLENKLEFEPLRVKIHALGVRSKSLPGLPAEIRRFLLACAKYLNVYYHSRKPQFGRSSKEFDHPYDSPDRVPDPDELEECYSAMYSGLLEAIENYLKDNDTDLLKSRLRAIETLLMERWSALSVAYADARLTMRG